MKYSELKRQRLRVGLSLSLILLLQLYCAPQDPIEEGRRVLEQAAEAMGGVAALGEIETLSRQGTKQRSSLGQARVASERLYVQPTRPYTQIIDFTVPREVELSGSGGSIRVTDWVKGGYNRDSRSLRIAQIRQLGGYKKEWDRDIAHFLVHALGEESQIEGISEGMVEERPHRVVSVRYIDGVLYQVYVDDSTHLISKLEFTEDRTPYGDLAKERIFSDYREVGNVKLPFSQVTKEMNLVTEVRTFSEMSVNGEIQEDLFEIPEEAREEAAALAHLDTIPVKAIELAEGVYFGSAGQSNMWVEFEDFILVADGPTNEMQSLEVIRQIRNTVGDKPIRYVVTTHHHADHQGGIRTYAAEGATIVTHALNEAVMREFLTRPHTLKPDRYSQSNQEPQIELVTDRRTITDGSRTVELMHLPNPHTDGYLVIYLPQEKLIFESDLFEILEGEAWPPLVRPEAKVFYEVVTEVGWKVDRIVSGHGRVVEWQELIDAIQASETSD
ncbi:MAG: MBL fold metallo-hydrolase [Acidobacteria bacterium]|nr:MBL fold metallo-hydrolase [Acidobacteriota bacterium]